MEGKGRGGKTEGRRKEKKRGKSGGVQKQGDDKEGKEKIEKEDGKEGGSIFMRGTFSSALYSDGAALWRHLHLAVPFTPSGTTEHRAMALGPERSLPEAIRREGRARAGPGGLRAGGAAPAAPARPSPVRHALGGVLSIAGCGQHQGGPRRAPAPVGRSHRWRRGCPSRATPAAPPHGRCRCRSCGKPGSPRAGRGKAGGTRRSRRAPLRSGPPAARGRCGTGGGSAEPRPG